MTRSSTFDREVADNIAALGLDSDVQALSRIWSRETNRHKYTYNFKWLGRPIIQYPQDIVAMQEIIWDVKPDLIIETGIAHGGSLVFLASMLELNAACGGPPEARVVGIDIDIREHNREAIVGHPLFKRIDMIQGSSIDAAVIDQVRSFATGASRVLVSLDSNHTAEHVAAELEAYAPLTSIGSYCVVFDTLVEDLPSEMFADRPWGPGNSPKTAVMAYLDRHPEFQADREIDHKLLITVAPSGYLKRIS